MQSVAEELRKNRIEVIPVEADITDEQGIQKIIEAAESVDVGLLVNNAGLATSGYFSDSSLEAECYQLKLNCEAVLRLTYHFAKHFKTQKRGGIIMLSSLVAFQGVPFAAGYAASKAYVQSLAEALAVEMKPFNVDILSAAPGPVQTAFEKRADMKMENAAQPEEIGVPILKALGKQKHVVPGILSKVLTYALRTAPRSLKVLIMGAIMGGFTQHQRNK